MTSAWNQGKVKMVIPGKDHRLVWISSLTWFFRNRGCRIMSWLKMNVYDNHANKKYRTWMPIRVIRIREISWRGR